MNLLREFGRTFTRLRARMNADFSSEPGTQFVVEIRTYGQRGGTWQFFISKHHHRFWAARFPIYDEWLVEESRYRDLLEWVHAKKKSGWLRSGNWCQRWGDHGILLRITCVDRDFPVCISIRVAKPMPQAALDVLHELLDRCGALMGKEPGEFAKGHLPQSFIGSAELEKLIDFRE